MKGAPTVHFNLPLLSFYLYTTFKTGIVAACEPIPLEQGRFGEWTRSTAGAHLAVALPQECLPSDAAPEAGPGHPGPRIQGGDLNKCRL